MHGRRIALGLFLAAAALAAALAGVTACGPSEEQLAAKADQARQEEMAALRQEKQDLDRLRAEARELLQQIESDESAEEAAEAGAPSPEDLQAKLDQLQQEIETKSTDLYNHVVEFINTDPPVEGEPRTEVQIEAISMKSDEDMLVAQEYIDKGGDYRRAISIYEDALRVDPDNPALQQALAEAQEMRWMTEERFSAVKKGLTEAEVRDLLGQPNLYNVRDYEDRGVTAWFYPKDESGAAAAVWFRGKPRKVYKLNFNELAGKEGGDTEGG
jgi:hypothetical protein